MNTTQVSRSGLCYDFNAMTLIPAWISNHISSKVCGEIICSVSNFDGCTIEVWEWINNFILHFKMDVIIFPCRDWSQSMLTKGATGIVAPWFSTGPPVQIKSGIQICHYVLMQCKISEGFNNESHSTQFKCAILHQLCFAFNTLIILIWKKR